MTTKLERTTGSLDALEAETALRTQAQQEYTAHRLAVLNVAEDEARARKQAEQNEKALAKINAELQQEIVKRKKIEEELRAQCLAALNVAEDEQRARKQAEQDEKAVAEINVELQQEIVKRKKIEEELRAQRLAALNVAEDEQRARKQGEQIEEALRESHNLLNAIVEGTSDAIAITDVKDRYIFVNAAGARWLGKSVDEVIGRDGTALFASDAAQKIMVQDRSVLADGKARDFENTISVAGTAKTYLVNKAPYLDNRGNVIGLIGVARDITERKEVEAALRASNERYQDLYDNAPDMFCSVDAATGKVLQCNQTLAAALGFQKEELIDRHISELYHPDCEPDRKRVFETFVNLGQVHDVELQLLRRDGSKLDVSLNISAVRDELGTVIRSRSIWRDITERKQMEERLRLNQFAIDNSADPIFWVRADGRISYVNRAACQALGYSYDELVSMTVPQIDPDFPQDKWAEHRREMREAGSLTFETHHRTKAGRVFPVEITTNLVEVDHQEYIWAYVRDITERKRTEEALRKAHDELEIRVRERTAELEKTNENLKHEIGERQRAEELARQREAELAHASRLSMMGEMAAGLAHELNQPLSAIMNFTDACERKLRSDMVNAAEVSHSLERIASMAERAGEIIRRLRNLVRKREPHRSTVDINEVIQQMVSLVTSEARFGGVEVRLELSNQLPQLSADSIQIQQVILNLVRNGIEAMQGTEISLRALAVRTTRSEAGTVEVAITDTGPGFAPEIAERLFEPFVTTKPQGLGMGLSISRSIITAHGGRLWVEPNPDRGVTFRFTLPVGGGNLNDRG